MRYTDKRRGEMEAREKSRAEREQLNPPKLKEPRPQEVQVRFHLDHKTEVFVRQSKIVKNLPRYWALAQVDNEAEFAAYCQLNSRLSPPVPDPVVPRTAESYQPRLVF